MKRSILLDTHPMYSLEILKSDAKVSNISEIVEHFKKKIEQNPEACFITLFDHYAHTKELDGEILDKIVAAKNLIFCFGHTIKNIEILAFRPKSIAICETKDSFVLEFLETPRPEVNAWMQSWIKELKK
jgi:predicted RNase H-like nuclease